MPIANTPLTKAQFEFLQDNITDQVTTVEQAGTIAQSGLHYVVLLQVDAPEVDLVTPFFFQLQRSESLAATSNWIPVVAALNNHAILRGAPATGTPSERLNAYLENGGDRILVSQDYANLSAEAGFIVDPCNIDPGTSAGCEPGFTSALTAAGTNGNPFSYTLTAVGTPTITFTVTTGTGQTGLPSGITFNGINTISGTHVGTGVFTVTMTATNGVGATSKTLTITIV